MSKLSFRTWTARKHGKKMIYFGLFDLDMNYIYGDGTIEEGAPIMQSTGLKDEKGTEIYEGDLVCGMHYGIYGTKPVIWWRAGWYTGTAEEQDVNVTSLSAVENPMVVGNIYATPKLIEEA